MLLAIGIISLFAWQAERPINEKNGFMRKFVGASLDTMGVMLREKNVTAAIGATEHQIFFQTNTPGKLFITDKHLGNEHYFSFDLVPDKKLSSLFFCAIDSPVVYVFAANVPAVFTGNLNTKSITRHLLPGTIYTRSAVVSPSNFMFRGFDKARGASNQVFLKGGLENNIIQWENGVSEKHNDGGIITDGLLHYDSLTHLLAYINFYRNLFLCLDTNLNLVYKGHTIDTFRTVATRNLPGEQRYSGGKPSRLINWENCVADGLLYNNSWIKSDNESIDNFKRNSVIDVYRLSDGQYEKSFYIPAFKGERLYRFWIFGDRIIVLYKHYIVAYTLNELFTWEKNYKRIK